MSLRLRHARLASRCNWKTTESLRAIPACLRMADRDAPKSLGDFGESAEGPEDTPADLAFLLDAGGRVQVDAQDVASEVNHVVDERVHALGAGDCVRVCPKSRGSELSSAPCIFGRLNSANRSICHASSVLSLTCTHRGLSMDAPDTIAGTPSIQEQTHVQPRKIVFRTRGNSHGPITRLVSPSDLGQLLKPFVFLDLFDTRDLMSFPKFGWHPHSGIATFTFLHEGEVAYSDSTGKSGILPEGGVEWMRAGNGVWHTGAPVGDDPKLGFQLWVALPPAEENAPPESIYLDPSQVPQRGPVRVLLGSHEGARSAIPAPGDMTYLGVKLRAGEEWTFTPNAQHQVGWLAVASGSVRAGEQVTAGELVIFADSEQPIHIAADEDTAFVMGSAVRHPYDLWLGNYSVHTSEERLAQGEAEIRRLGITLRDEGRFKSAA